MLLCGDTWWTQQYSVILINEIVDCYVVNFIIVSNILVVGHTTNRMNLTASCWHFNLRTSPMNVALRACIMTCIMSMRYDICIMSTVKVSMSLVFLRISVYSIMTACNVDPLCLSVCLSVSVCWVCRFSGCQEMLLWVTALFSRPLCPKGEHPSSLKWTLLSQPVRTARCRDLHHWHHCHQPP